LNPRKELGKWQPEPIDQEHERGERWDDPATLDGRDKAACQGFPERRLGQARLDSSAAQRFPDRTGKVAIRPADTMFMNS